MQDVVDSLTGGAYCRSIAQVGLSEVDQAIKPGKVGRLPGQVVVDSADLFAAFHQGPRQG